MTRVDDGALARLNEQQMQPVDDARIEEGRAKDGLARAKLAVADSKAKIEVAKAEREVAVAQLNRTKAEADLLNQQKADLKDIERAKLDAQMAAERVRAVDLKIDYLNKTIGIANLEQEVATQHAIVAQEVTERAKYQALQQGQPNQVRDINPASLDSQLANAQAKEAQLRKQAADQRVALVEVYNKWQELDAKVRSAPAPQNSPPPQPTMPSQPTTR